MRSPQKHFSNLQTHPALRESAFFLWKTVRCGHIEKQTVFAFFIVLISLTVPAGSLLAQPISKDNYDRVVPHGKEVDAIYGDAALVNEKSKAVIALPSPVRNANMTVRSIGGGLIDFAAKNRESDQLSCFYPGRRKFPFSQLDADARKVVVTSTGNGNRADCVVTYQLLSDLPVMEITSTWTNQTRTELQLTLEDDIRADGGKERMVRSPNGTHDVFYFDDTFWRQAYVVCAKGYKIRSNSNSRECVLVYERPNGEATVLKPGDSFSLTRHMVVAENLCDARVIAEDLADLPIRSYQASITLTDGNGDPTAGAHIELSRDGQLRGTLLTDAEGHVETELPVGSYTVKATVAGIPVLSNHPIEIVAQKNLIYRQYGLYQPGIVNVSVKDDAGRSIPAKVEFKGNGDTATPDWGPETAEHFVGNLAYTPDGRFTVKLQQGTYDVIVSRGPEYDAVFTKVKVTSGKTVALDAVLNHSVKTPGWVSSDFHSHSSPSGDNTGSQLGRVLNLAAEHIEFAPCTEHNRISTYSGHIASLGLQPFLATVSGMELTGQPLPLNHQNVFPMVHKPRTQDGGGPITDASPETQIERLELWDDRSEKLIQQNHPDIGWLFFDKNGDGDPDGGYQRSFPFMDVMEIHPIDRILKLTQFDQRDGKAINNNRMLNWLQLLNQGHRVFGVVNTDAHYNFHGSGWLRNWIYSSTDDPAKIDPMEMVRHSEQGHLIMSNGPYLSATFQHSGVGQAMVCGGELDANDGRVTVQVKVQCPNWLNVDTVFLLINGRMSDEFTFTKDAHPKMFKDGVVKFDETINLTLQKDAHIIVATGHRTEILGDVMGPTWGQQHPAAVTNPLFVDVGGNGFEPSKDTLDHPLPVKFQAPK